MSSEPEVIIPPSCLASSLVAPGAASGRRSREDARGARDAAARRRGRAAARARTGAGADGRTRLAPPQPARGFGRRAQVDRSGLWLGYRCRRRARERRDRGGCRGAGDGDDRSEDVAERAAAARRPEPDDRPDGEHAVALGHAPPPAHLCARQEPPSAAVCCLFRHIGADLYSSLVHVLLNCST